jgi:hypothetical protein
VEFRVERADFEVYRDRESVGKRRDRGVLVQQERPDVTRHGAV